MGRTFVTGATMTPERHPVTIEGFSPAEVLALDDEAIDAYALTGAPLDLRVGTGRVLLECRVVGATLVVELAHIDGGGEGVLVTLSALVHRLARRRRLREVDWIVHALTCARPNDRLRAALERRGFAVEHVPGVGMALRLVTPIAP
jgi:hypothetical protein